jgi:nickel-dependent lactate racemase
MSRRGYKPYPVDWNGEARTLDVPRDNVAAEIRMTDYSARANPWAAIAAALESPVGCPPLSEMLRPGSRVALLTGDRFTDQMLGPWGGLGCKLLDYLNRLGIRDEDVTLIYAPGSHASPHWRERLGEALLDRVRALRHDCYDEESLAYLGVTGHGTPLWVNRAVVEADFRLAIGEISPNVHGGWCGGGKIILPGVAGWDSIEQNHCGVVREVNTLGLADGNPMRLDMEDAARMARLDFKIDVLVDSQARIVDVYAGNPVAAHRAALERKARRIWMTRAPPADIYVLYPGQGSERYLSSSFFIRIEGAELGTKEDGVILLALSAAGGWAPSQSSTDRHWISPEHNAALFKAGTEALARAMVRRTANVRTCSMLYTARRVLERRACFLVCDGISPQEAREFGFQHCTSHFDDALSLALEQQGRNARITVNNVSNAPSEWLGRPVAWRAMPWREG